MGPLSGFVILIGIVFVTIGLVMRKFWPDNRGNIEFWVLNFETSAWLSWMIPEIFMMACGLVLGIMTPI